MKSIIALKRKYEDKVAEKSCWQIQYVGLFLTLVILLGGLAGCALSNTSRWRMEGKSMEPNVSDGQIVVVEPVADFSSLQRGDMIILEWNEESLLKRLVGLPRETIEIRQGSIIINGKVYDEPYEVIAPEYEIEPTTLGENEYYVLGDNRNNSRDSHNFGPITGDMISGQVVP